MRLRPEGGRRELKRERQPPLILLGIVKSLKLAASSLHKAETLEILGLKSDMRKITWKVQARELYEPIELLSKQYLL